MAYENILFETSAKIATVTLNRPQALNAMTLPLMDELNDAFAKAAADPDVRVIVLTGSGRGFCAGADLATTAGDPPRDPEGRIDLGQVLERWYEPLILRMRALEKPIISAVNGIAAGAGCSLALNADLTIAAQSAKFLQAFVNVGLVPDAGGTWLLPHLTTMQRAMGMALLGDKITAEQAQAWGLIWQVVPDADLTTTVQAVSARLADGPSIAISAIKRALYAAPNNDMASQLVLERELQRRCGATEDFMEGAVAFLQKRKASFQGR